jgi:hypothetical protein
MPLKSAIRSISQNPSVAQRYAPSGAADRFTLHASFFASDSGAVWGITAVVFRQWFCFTQQSTINQNTTLHYTTGTSTPVTPFRQQRNCSPADG